MLETETGQNSADVRREHSYEKMLDTFVKDVYLGVYLRPWRGKRLDSAYLAREVRDISKVQNLPAEKVWDDLHVKIEHARSSLAGWLRFIPLAFYYVTRAVKFWITWQAYARLWSSRYVRELDDDWFGEESWQKKPTVESPLASVVVLSFNRLAYLKTTLHSLFQTLEPNEVELIVVDNGSTDGSAEFVCELAERGAIDKAILCSRNLGSSKGFNLGFAHANPSSKYLTKFDGDIVALTPGWLRRFDRFLTTQRDVGVVAMTQVNHFVLTCPPRKTLAGEEVSSWNWGVCGGSGMTMSREVFSRFGYFREDFDFPYMPLDKDSSLRLALLGYENYYLQECESYHRADLDHSLYKKEQSRKGSQSRQRWHAKEQLVRGYATGELSPTVFYPHYASCQSNDRIIEIA